MKQWNPDDALKSLTAEETIMEHTKESLAKSIFDQNAPIAAQAIAHLAQFSENEQVRFKAATYVVERCMGRLQDAPPLHDDPLEAFLQELTKEANS